MARVSRIPDNEVGRAAARVASGETAVSEEAGALGLSPGGFRAAVQRVLGRPLSALQKESGAPPASAVELPVALEAPPGIEILPGRSDAEFMAFSRIREHIGIEFSLAPSGESDMQVFPQGKIIERDGVREGLVVKRGGAWALPAESAAEIREVAVRELARLQAKGEERGWPDERLIAVLEVLLRDKYGLAASTWRAEAEIAADEQRQAEKAAKALAEYEAKLKATYEEHGMLKPRVPSWEFHIDESSEADKQGNRLVIREWLGGGAMVECDVLNERGELAGVAVEMQSGARVLSAERGGDAKVEVSCVVRDNFKIAWGWVTLPHTQRQKERGEEQRIEKRRACLASRSEVRVATLRGSSAGVSRLLRVFRAGLSPALAAKAGVEWKVSSENSPPQLEHFAVPDPAMVKALLEKALGVKGGLGLAVTEWHC